MQMSREWVYPYASPLQSPVTPPDNKRAKLKSKTSALRKLKSTLFSSSKDSQPSDDDGVRVASPALVVPSGLVRMSPHSRLARINTDLSSISAVESASTSRFSHRTTPSWGSCSTSTSASVSFLSYPSPSPTSTWSTGSARSPCSVMHQFPFPLVTLEEAAENRSLVLGKESYELDDDYTLEPEFGYETECAEKEYGDVFARRSLYGREFHIDFGRRNTSDAPSPHSSYYSCKSHFTYGSKHDSKMHDDDYMDDLLPPLPAQVSEALEVAADMRRRSNDRRTVSRGFVVSKTCCMSSDEKSK